MSILKWKTVSAKGQVTFETDFKEAKGNGSAALAELWAKVLDETERAYPKADWEILICYVEVESGSVLIYPARHGKYEWVDALVNVSLVHHGWETEYEEFAELIDTDEKRFEKAYEKQLKRIMMSLKEAISDGSVSAQFKQLKRRPGFGAFTVDGGESVGSSNLKFLWGNRQPKAIAVESAKELFSLILRKAHLHPDSSMELDGDRVRKVDWFGGDFNDKFVDLLEQVPNLKELCAEVEELSLTATRIKPAGVERLKRLLPNLRVKVVTSAEWEQAEMEDE